MSTILCLAHYCDTHGPTPLMVTEALPVGCSSCFEGQDSRRPSTSSRSLEGIRSAGRQNSTSSESGHPGRASAPALETPPESPRVAALHGRRDSSFRKTYDENDKKRAIACENCALTLPRKTNIGSHGDGKQDSNGPILRTRKPYKRISIPLENPSPPKSASSDSSTSSSDSENAVAERDTYSHRRAHSRTVVRIGTSSSNSSFNSTSSHDHYLDYTSTHEPLSSSSFSIIRQSCLRTLSCETLPPSSSQSSNPPTSPYLSQFSSGGVTSTSGGPIFFGDPLAGYTTAYIFRIPDPNARGRRRVYALMALSTHRERLAMQTFPYLSTAFRDLASWIQTLAENELSDVDSPRSEYMGEGSKNSTPTSSFLSGRGLGRGVDGIKGMSLKSRGLAEIVGLPDFFLELHARFVRLLCELRAVLGA